MITSPGILHWVSFQLCVRVGVGMAASALGPMCVTALMEPFHHPAMSKYFSIFILTPVTMVNKPVNERNYIKP